MTVIAPRRRATAAPSAWERSRRVRERHPAWPVLALGALGWIGLLITDRGAAGGGSGHGGHAGSASTTSDAVLVWGLMVVAMMVPALVPAMQRLADVVPSRRRPWAMAVVVGTVVAVWLPGALVPSVLGTPPAVAVAALLALAAAWELGPVKRRALRRCHRYPVVRTRGSALARSCLRFGMHQARWCVVSCGPAMLAVAATGHALAPMAVVSGGVMAERVLDGRRSVQRTAALGLIAIAGLWLLLARA